MVVVDWGEGEKGGREGEGETMAHDEDYLMTFCSFSFLFFSFLDLYIYTFDDEIRCTFYIILAAHTSFPFLFGFVKKKKKKEKKNKNKKRYRC